MKRRAGGAIAVAIACAVSACLLPGCARRSREPAASGLAGSESCAECHAEESRLWRYGAHRAVACEQCHGPGLGHARAEGAARPAMGLGGAALCLSCHGPGGVSSARAASRIESFEDHLSNLERDHRIKLDRQKSGADCVYCHDPHLLE